MREERSAAAGDVADPVLDDEDPSQLLTAYARRRFNAVFEDWHEDFVDRTDLADITARQRRLRAAFREAVGGLPEGLPLEPIVTDQFRHDGCRVETVQFQSAPSHRVTATVYLPDPATYQPPYPGVVVPCGHSSVGKAAETYQAAGQLLARNGLVGLVYDPLCQGERYQLFAGNGSERDSSPMVGHMHVGANSMPLGRSVAGFRIRDGMRAIDYLASHDAVDGDRIGAMGNSGGGTLTAYLGALDDRVVAAAVSCYITSWETFLADRIADDAEQNIHGQHEFGLHYPDLLTMRAPAPTLVCAATDDFFDIEGTWDSVRYAKRLYGRLGHPERIDIAEVETGHGFQPLLRGAAVGWMVRWLRDEDRSVEGRTDPPTLPPEALYASPDGLVTAIDGERTVFDLNAAYAHDLELHRERRWQEESQSARRDAVRECAGIRPLEDIPAPTIRTVGEERIHSGTVERLVFQTGHGVPLPAIRATPEERSGSPVVALHENGKGAVDIVSLVADGREVLAVDPRGIGETDPDRVEPKWDGIFGTDSREAMAAYRFGESLVGWRAEDTLLAARWFATDTDPLALRATGAVGIPALHAAALEPTLFDDVRLEGCLTAWDDLVRTPGAPISYGNLVHGALAVYDLPDLVELLGTTVTWSNPTDPAPEYAVP